MIDVILAIIILALVLSACLYIRKEMKKGKRCIGCPASGCCTKKNCKN